MRFYSAIAGILTCLAISSCGKPAVDLVFNTSTGAYPVNSGSDGSALETLSEDGFPMTSYVRIEMAGIAEAKMRGVHLRSLVLKAMEGDLRFIQIARCHVRSGGKMHQLGEAKVSDLSADYKSLKLNVNHEADLTDVVRNPFTIFVEIEGEAPSTKTSISADLTFKTKVEL